MIHSMIAAALCLSTREQAPNAMQSASSTTMKKSFRMKEVRRIGYSR